MASVQGADLEAARGRTSFDSKIIKELVWPENRRKLTDDLVRIMSQDPLLDKDKRRHFSRQQLLEHGYKIQLRMIKLKHIHQWDHEVFLRAVQLVDDHVPYGLHYTAFMPVVQSQGSDEQIAEWLPKCHSLEVIGCYAQTELGHGSNVQRLETTATFDKASQSFIINSPTLTSAKWWVGGLGTVANHAVVQAQLVIFKRDYGPHLFIVPLRDSKTHRPFSGIDIGDIGPKHYGGFNMNDNGFVRFDHVKIPMANFLNRYAKVDAQGAYSPAGHAKIGYGSMVALRAGMPVVLGLELAQCLTIAVRYTTVRRQFSEPVPKTTDKIEDSTGAAGSKGRELQVIKYGSVKERLIPLLAASYVYVLAGHSTMALYKKMLAALVAPPHDASSLAEVHLLTSGLKAVLSWNVVGGMEEARKALGGHGFSIYSGIGERFAKEVPGQTYEGDNYVLVQQTAKGLLKNYQLLQSGRSKGMMASTVFLANLPKTYSAQTKVDWFNRSAQMTLLGLVTKSLLHDLTERSRTEPWRTLNMDCVRLTRAFVDHYLAAEFCKSIAVVTDASCKRVLQKLADIFILNSLKLSIPELAEFDLIAASHIKALRSASRASLDAIEDDLVGLTDAFAFTDWELNSVLGRHDGDVYAALWRTVNERNPVNTSRRDAVVSSYETLLAPLHSTAMGVSKL